MSNSSTSIDFISNKFNSSSPLKDTTRPKLSPQDLNSTNSSNNGNRNSYFIISNNDNSSDLTSSSNNNSNGNSFNKNLNNSTFDFNMPSTSSNNSIKTTDSITSSVTSNNQGLSHSMRGPSSPALTSSILPIPSTSNSKPFLPNLTSSPSLKRHNIHPHTRAPPPSISSNRFIQFTPQSINSLLSSSPQTLNTHELTNSNTSNPSSILLLDIRTHTSWIECRFKSSINICVPSTLLRRANYGVDRISEGLMASERIEFDKWSTVKHIIVLDMESISLKEGSGISSLLSKFSAAGFTGELGWVKGGFIALRADAKQSSSGRGLLQYGEGDSMDGSSCNGSSPGIRSSHSSASNSMTTVPSTPGATINLRHSIARPILQVRDLPVSAFQQASTSAFTHAGLPSASLNMGGRPTSSSKSSRPGLGKRRKSGGPSLCIDMPAGMSAGSTTPGGNSIAEKRMATNPFFDNIRQNSEALSLTRSLANLSPIELPEVSPEISARLPPFLSNLLKLSPIERAHLLARQFYELEVAERERLEGTLNWHATVQHADGEKIEESSLYRKFGISAGVELGNLNRFKNIFPYDCARVRLKVANSSSTDYINASHVHIETSPKRFIASQGPLPTTFSDFFQVCFQENIGVIIMLTNLREGGREKCGNYWKLDSDNVWDIKVEGGEEAEEVSGGFFSGPSIKAVSTSEAVDSTIRRTFYIRRKGDTNPDNVRKIRHIQYRAWPDFDVPATPTDLVDLVEEVEQAQKEYLTEVSWKGEEDPPIMTHCSGGIGRTGVFIAVLTLLDKLRRDKELKNSRYGGEKKFEGIDDMDVDPPSLTRAGNSYNSASSSSSGTGTSSSYISSSPPSSFSTFLPSPTESVFSDTTTSLLAANLQSSTLNSCPTPSPTFNLLPITGGEETVTTPLTIRTESISKDDSKGNISTPTNNIVPPLLRHDPIFASVNEMRTYRMSMVANFRQYVSIYETTLVGYLQMLNQEKE